MIIPIKDKKYNQIQPVATYLFIALNVVVFFGWTLSKEYIHTVNKFGILTSNFRFYSLLTYTFFHAHWAHLVGNMAFFWFFGRNVERKIGIILFITAYFLIGIGAATFHIIFNSNLDIPMVGASGAIYGILGMYLLFFKNRPIELGYFALFTAGTVEIPAYWFIGIYFLIDLSLALVVNAADMVAHWAHVGGFVMGILFVLVLLRILHFKGYRGDEVIYTPPIENNNAEPNDFSDLDYIP